MKNAQSRNNVEKAQQQIFYKAYEQPVEHLAVSRLDPLHCDSDMAELPAWNQTRNIDAIAAAAVRIAPSLESIQGMTDQEARAALRDLGMLLVSIKRHGTEPETIIPDVTPSLLALGAQTQMVPRETIMHYSVWNPDGGRQRCFTNLRDEVKIIQGTKMAVPGLERAIFALTELYYCAPHSPDFATYANLVYTNINAMVKAIVFSIVNVNPRVFAAELRPYYDPFIINGIEYMGAGAVQLPLFVFDYILWSSDCNDSTLITFQEENIHYCIPAFRKLFFSFKGKPSLAQKLCHIIQNSHSCSSDIRQSAQSVVDIFDTLIRFRTPHKSLAYRAFSHRNDTAVGSGGYRPNILDHILELTLKAKHNLKNVLKAGEFP